MLLTVLSIFDTKVSKRLLISLGSWARLKLQWHSNLSIQLKHNNLLSYSPQVLIKLLLAIRLFQKKIQTEGGGDFRQNEVSPLEIPQNCVIPIGIILFFWNSPLIMLCLRNFVPQDLYFIHFHSSCVKNPLSSKMHLWDTNFTVKVLFSRSNFTKFFVKCNILLPFLDN